MGSNRNIILEYLVDTLFPTITTANGYNFTVQTVARDLKQPDQINIGKFPALFVASADEDCNDISNGQFQSEMIVAIYGFVIKNSTTQELQPEIDKLIEDIRKCLYKDPTQSNKTGYTHILGFTVSEGNEDQWGWFRGEVKFAYQGTYTSP